MTPSLEPGFLHQNGDTWDGQMHIFVITYPIPYIYKQDMTSQLLQATPNAQVRPHTPDHSLIAVQPIHEAPPKAEYA